MAISHALCVQMEHICYRFDRRMITVTKFLNFSCMMRSLEKSVCDRLITFWRVWMELVLMVQYWSYCEFNTFLCFNKEGNVLFNDTLNTFYLRLYCVRHMVKDHSDSEKGNPLPPHRLIFPINSKGSFICTIPQTG